MKTLLFLVFALLPVFPLLSQDEFPDIAELPGLSKHQLDDLQNESLRNHENYVVGKRLEYNSSIETILNLVANKELANEEFRDNLALSEDQMTELRALLTTFNDLKKSLESKELDEYQWNIETLKLRKNLMKQVCEALLPHQLENLVAVDISHTGLPRLIVASPISSVLKLSEKQKRDIKDRSDKLAKKIERMIHEIRQEAFDIVDEELTDEQIESLENLYGKHFAKEYLSRRSVEQLFREYIFELPENFNQKQHPSVIVNKTEIKNSK